MKYSNSYLIELQFLGFRFHGWQKQLDVKTLHESVDKSLSYVFGHFDFKTIGVGRTDSKVSANNYFIQLFVAKPLSEMSFLEALNSNFPPDFKALFIEKINSKFSVIQSDKVKEYHYYFSFGEKNHPYAAPFVFGHMETLDINSMMQGASLFQGTHYFHKYCTKPSKDKIFKRHIEVCEIVKNDILEASFFPKKSYVLKVKGKGFMRYQIRLMMAMLFELGKGNTSIQEIKDSLKETNDRLPLRTIAPASGLHLYKVTFLNK